MTGDDFKKDFDNNNTGAVWALGTCALGGFGAGAAASAIGVGAQKTKFITGQFAKAVNPVSRSIAIEGSLLCAVSVGVQKLEGKEKIEVSEAKILELTSGAEAGIKDAAQLLKDGEIKEFGNRMAMTLGFQEIPKPTMPKSLNVEQFKENFQSATTPATVDLPEISTPTARRRA